MLFFSALVFRFRLDCRKKRKGRRMVGYMEIFLGNFLEHELQQLCTVDQDD